MKGLASSLSPEVGGIAEDAGLPHIRFWATVREKYLVPSFYFYRLGGT